MRNVAAIGGWLLKRSALRYTPAGVPIVDFVIAHSSVQIEAGSRRKVQCDVEAVAVGDLAGTIEQVKINQSVQIKGFLARDSMGNTRLKLHATGIELISGDTE